MIDTQRIVATFCEIVRIDSVSREEDAIAKDLTYRLKELGLEVIEDKFGNLVTVEEDKQGWGQNREKNQSVKVKRTDDPHVGAQFICNRGQAGCTTWNTAQQSSVEVDGGQFVQQHSQDQSKGNQSDDDAPCGQDYFPQQ